MIKFSSRLKELRQAKKLSQQSLADFIGISKSSINMYERGEREPGLEMLEVLADFFNVDLDYIIGKSDIANRYLLGFSYNSTVDEGHILYDKLDTEDKAEIRGEMKQMLKDDKYTAPEEPEGKLNA